MIHINICIYKYIYIISAYLHFGLSQNEKTTTKHDTVSANYKLFAILTTKGRVWVFGISAVFLPGEPGYSNKTAQI